MLAAYGCAKWMWTCRHAGRGDEQYRAALASAMWALRVSCPRDTADVTIMVVGGKARRLWPMAAIVVVIAVAGALVWVVWRSPHRSRSVHVRGVRCRGHRAGGKPGRLSDEGQAGWRYGPGPAAR